MDTNEVTTTEPMRESSRESEDEKPRSSGSPTVDGAFVEVPDDGSAFSACESTRESSHEGGDEEPRSSLGSPKIDDALVEVPDDGTASSTCKLSNGTNTARVFSNGASDVERFWTNKQIRDLFRRLCYSEDALSALPNRTWAIHATETPDKRIVVSSMTMRTYMESGIAPFYEKQIIFDERLNFDILLANMKIVLKDKPTSISSIQDFEDLVDYVDSMRVCAGGPSASQYSHVYPECAYRDTMNNWRHNLCSLEIICGNVCDACNSLEDILRRHAQRNKSSFKSTGKRKR